MCNYVVKQCICVLLSYVCLNLFQWTFYKYQEISLRKKCPYSEFFSPYSVRMRENTDQKSSECEHFHVVFEKWDSRSRCHVREQKHWELSLEIKGSEYISVFFKFFWIFGFFINFNACFNKNKKMLFESKGFYDLWLNF